MLRPDRLRVIERPFGWLPCRLLSDGWLETLSQPAQLLYLLLAMAADRQGLSFYGDARIEHVLALGAGELVRARQELTDAVKCKVIGEIVRGPGEIPVKIGKIAARRIVEGRTRAVIVVYRLAPR